jgi:hypothetical protein
MLTIVQAVALEHSFTVNAAFVNDRGDSSPSTSASASSGSATLTGAARRRKDRRLIGLGRTISDGSFAALVVDLCVHPDYQRKGIGRRLLGDLLGQTKRMGPESFAAFPRPGERIFFWKNSWRWNPKYVIMKYTGIPSSSLKRGPRGRKGAAAAVAELDFAGRGVGEGDSLVVSDSEGSEEEGDGQGEGGADSTVEGDGLLPPPSDADGAEGDVSETQAEGT